MSFDAAVRFVLDQEGGYVDDPRDPGRATRFGISRRSHPGEDIPNLTLRRARTIYREAYWDRCGCDALPEPLASLVFDAAVNQGPRVAVEMLQRALGTVPDGVVGPRTLAAARRRGQERDVVLKLAAERGFRYGTAEHFPTYGRGWMRRLMAALAMALEGTWR